MLSSLFLPLTASYIGITVFLLSRLFITPVWVPALDLTIIMYLLTTVEALVMVSGAVVVSSQTTSVRAANLLASFIIIPMALLIQAESVVMFYAEYKALWWFILALLVVNLILVRMGIRTFNREDILSKEMDQLHPKIIWSDLWGYFLRPPDVAAQKSNRQATKFDLLRIYRHDIPQLLRDQFMPFGVILIATLVAVGVGIIYARQYPIPAGAFFRSMKFLHILLTGCKALDLCHLSPQCLFF
jgi:hypothetical protein